MCINCWEDAGSPAIINDKIRHAVNLIEKLYETEWGAAGAYGHIVFDDWNVMSAESCIPDAEKGGRREGDEESRLASLAALKAFVLLSEDERYSCLALLDGFIKETV